MISIIKYQLYQLIKYNSIVIYHTLIEYIQFYRKNISDFNNIEIMLCYEEYESHSSRSYSYIKDVHHHGIFPINNYKINSY